MTKSSVLACVTYILSAVISVTASAASLPEPTGKVILTISGQITHTNTDNNTAEFDREMLLSLGVFDVETVTPWTEGSDLYQGPMLSSVLQASSCSFTASDIFLNNSFGVSALYLIVITNSYFTVSSAASASGMPNRIAISDIIIITNNNPVIDSCALPFCVFILRTPFCVLYLFKP